MGMNLFSPQALPVNVGSTVFYPLFVGQDSTSIPKTDSLPCDFYYVGEVVSILRSDGKRIIGQVLAATPHMANIDCGGGVLQLVPGADVPLFISKLIGAYYPAGETYVPSPSLYPFIGVQQPLQLGKMVLTPLQLGQDSGGIARKNGLSSEYYYVGEAVAVARSDGRNTVGRVLSVSSDAVNVSLGGSSEKKVLAANVRSLMSKLIGPFYIPAALGGTKPSPREGPISRTISVSPAAKLSAPSPALVEPPPGLFGHEVCDESVVQSGAYARRVCLMQGARSIMRRSRPIPLS